MDQTQENATTDNAARPGNAALEQARAHLAAHQGRSVEPTAQAGRNLVGSSHEETAYTGPDLLRRADEERKSTYVTRGNSPFHGNFPLHSSKGRHAKNTPGVGNLNALETDSTEAALAAFRARLPLIAAVLVLAAVIFTASFLYSSHQKNLDVSTPATSDARQNAENDAKQRSEKARNAAQTEQESIQKSLTKILGKKKAKEFMKAAENDENLRWIEQNLDAYSLSKDDMSRLLNLALNEPKAAKMTRNLPDQYPAKKAGNCKKDKLKKGKIPRLYQWDSRWAYTEYSSAPFALNGCAPTCFAMIYQGIMRDTDVSPYDMGQVAREDGYESESSGTYGDFFADEAADFGLYCAEVDLDEDSVLGFLEYGYVLIVNVGPGDFCTSGHFIVVTAADEDGQLTINDPFSIVNSKQKWDVNRILNQSITIWAFKKAESDVEDEEESSDDSSAEYTEYTEDYSEDHSEETY